MAAAVELGPGIKLSMLIPPQPSDADLRFVAELGLSHVFTWVPAELSGTAELRALRRLVEDAGLTLFNVGHASLAKCDRIHLALPGRDAAIYGFATFLRHLGAAGIHTTTFTFEPDGVWSTTPSVARGGRRHGRWTAPSWPHSPSATAAPTTRRRSGTTSPTSWSASFRSRRRRGVRLALHPNDPPVPQIAGIPCLIRSWESYDRAFAIADSDCLGMEFCTGCWLEGGSAFGDIVAAVRDFIARDKIFIVHFRNVSSPLPHFHETFVDEGYQDMNVLMRLFRDGGYRGTMILDHTPPMAHDAAAQGDLAIARPVATAYALGYMKALLAAAGG